MSAKYAVDGNVRAVKVAGRDPFVIACLGFAILETRPNGQASHMSYKTRQGASNALRRVRASGLPDAYIWHRSDRELRLTRPGVDPEEDALLDRSQQDAERSGGYGAGTL